MNFDTVCIHFKGDRYNPICIPYKYILHLDLQNVTNAYFLDRSKENVESFEGRHAYEESHVSNFESKIAKKVFINIHNNANRELQNSKYKTNFEKILSRRDIFYLEFFLNQESVAKIRVPWDNKTNFEEYNDLEFAFLYSGGNLGIKIKF